MGCSDAELDDLITRQAEAMDSMAELDRADRIIMNNRRARNMPETAENPNNIEVFNRRRQNRDGEGLDEDLDPNGRPRDRDNPDENPDEVPRNRRGKKSNDEDPMNQILKIKD